MNPFSCQRRQGEAARNSLQEPLRDKFAEERGKPRENEQLFGEPPPTSVSDFDLCFVFPLPGIVEGLREAAAAASSADVSKELLKIAEEAAEEEQDANEHFLEELDKRSRRRSVQENDGDKMQRLFKDFFLEHEDADEFECGPMGNLEDARTACITIFLDLFRRQEEPYYSLLFTSVDRDELILCVKMTEKTALWHAQHSDYAAQLSMSAVQGKLNIKLAPGPGGMDGAAMKPAYAKYDNNAHLMRRHECESNPKCNAIMKKIDNIRLLYDRITDVLDVERMKKWNLLKTIFPLHSRSKLTHFRSTWASIKLFYSIEQPIEEIRDYFGENVTLYFVFIQHICEYTWYLVLVGVLVFALDLYADGGGQYGTKKLFLETFGGVRGFPPLRLAFAGFIIIWCNFFVVFLRRKIRYYQNVWGMDTGIQNTVKPQLNPRFAVNAQMIPSEVDLNFYELNVPSNVRRRGRMVSFVGSILFIACVFFIVSLIFRKQAELAHAGKLGAASLISYGLSIQIKVFNAIWGILCQHLTDQEHLPDQLQFDESVALKTFYVQTMNMFCSFYYIAFFMKPWGDTSYSTYGDHPWQYLTYQMFSTFGLYLLFSAYDLISPMYALWSSKKEELHKLKKMGFLPKSAKSLEYSFIELQTKMDAYGGSEQNDDFIDVLSVFGFILLFGISLPIGSVFALIYLVLQMRVDAWKLCNAMKRPYPRRMQAKTWVWTSITEQFVHLGVLTNIGLICFCMEPCSRLETTEKFLVFFVLMLSSVVLNISLSWLLPETSAEVELAVRRHQRQRALAHKVGKTVRDDGSTSVKLTASTQADFASVPGLRMDRGDLFK